MDRYIVLRLGTKQGDWRACSEAVAAESPENAAFAVAKGRRGVYVAIPTSAWSHTVAVD